MLPALNCKARSLKMRTKVTPSRTDLAVATQAPEANGSHLGARIAVKHILKDAHGKREREQYFNGTVTEVAEEGNVLVSFDDSDRSWIDLRTSDFRFVGRPATPRTQTFDRSTWIGYRVSVLWRDPSGADWYVGVVTDMDQSGTSITVQYSDGDTAQHKLSSKEECIHRIGAPSLREALDIIKGDSRLQKYRRERLLGNVPDPRVGGIKLQHITLPVQLKDMVGYTCASKYRRCVRPRRKRNEPTHLPRLSTFPRFYALVTDAFFCPCFA